MPVPAATTGLTPQTKRTQPVVIAIPGSKRLTSRRSAQNRSASVSAYVVRDSKSNISNTLSVSVKRNSRLMALTLKGHTNQIVDLEFLSSSASEPIFVLGTCDTDGVVFLWFLYIAKDALGIDVALRMLKKYSFYSLRRSTSAFYTRIRLAGTPENGTMVLVPNDGSNCRVVNFTCEPLQPQHVSETPAIAGTDPVPQLPPPEQSPPTRDTPAVQGDTLAMGSETVPAEASRSAAPAVATTLAAGAVGVAAASAAVGSTAEDDIEKVIGEGLHGDHNSAQVMENTGTFEPATIVEDAEEEEFMDAVEHVIPPVEQPDHVYGEGLVEAPMPAYGAPVEEVRGTHDLSGEYEQVVENEEVIAEEVIYDDEEELEEHEDEEYEEYEEPEVERVYGEGLSNGHEPNYAPPY